MRLLQHHTTGKYTRLGRQLPDFEKEVGRLRSLPIDRYHDSVRLHIPRTVQLILDVRNRRDIGHVGGDVDPNLSDATMVMTNASWILTEFLRLFYTSSVEEAQQLVTDIMERQVPLVWEKAGSLKVLNPRLSLRETLMALLYVKGNEGASREDLLNWSQTPNRYYASDVLGKLEMERLIHLSEESIFITPLGEIWVEKNVDFKIPV
ncbi:MAG: hypothetical protein V3U51_01240 [Thermoplasmata archaeon]